MKKRIARIIATVMLIAAFCLCVASGDMGKNSGWLFTVNGEMPMDYCDKIPVNDGDEIVWDFTEGM